MTFPDHQRVPVTDYGMTYHPSFATMAAIQVAQRWRGWEGLPSTPCSLQRPLKALDRYVTFGPINKVASGVETLHAGYDPWILHTDQGSFVIDGRYRVAMHHALGHEVMNARQIHVDDLPRPTARRRVADRADPLTFERLAPHNDPTGDPNPHATEFDRVNPATQAKVKANFLANNPNPAQGDLDHERMVQNVMGLYRRAAQHNPEDVEEGKHWYQTAHDEASDLANKHGIPFHRSVGMVAALSPQLEWGSNVSQARYIMQKLHEDAPVHFDDYHRSEIDRKTTGGRRSKNPFVVPEGKRLSEMTPDEAGAALHQMMVRDAPPSLTMKKDGTPSKTLTSNGIGPVSKAVRIWKGEHPDDVLAGHKVRSFANNIGNPDDPDHDDVTMDTHAISLAARAKMAAGSTALANLMNMGSSRPDNVQAAYAHVADAYREAHRRLMASGEMAPDSHSHQLQAATWLHWRRLTDKRGPLNIDGESVPRHENKRIPKAVAAAWFFGGDMAGWQRLDPWYVPEGENPHPDLDPPDIDQLDDEEEMPLEDPYDERHHLAWGGGLQDGTSMEDSLDRLTGPGSEISGDSSGLGGWPDESAIDWDPGAHSTWDPGAQATWSPEPEPALPSTDGEEDGPEEVSHLGHRVARVFSPAEQFDLIHEGEDGVTASNLSRLDISNTHYEELERGQSSHDDDDLWMI